MNNLIPFLAKQIFFKIRVKRENSTLLKHLDEFEKSQYYSLDKIQELQLQRLRQLLQHAYAHCPFYTRRFNEIGFNPDKLQSFDDFNQLPVLTKKDIQKHASEMKASNLNSDLIIPDQTGGSTGSPLHFFMDQDRVYSRNASAIRHDRWTGWDIGMKSAYLWGHRGDIAASKGIKAKLNQFLIDRRLILDTSNITSKRLAQFDLELQKYRPNLYVAYSNSVYLFAKYLKSKNSSNHHKPHAIITSAELLDNSQRTLIESVFECKVYNRYGSRETSIIASECNQHTGLHICAEAIYVEIQKQEKLAKANEKGKIILTDLLNYGMPFIRYQIEDIGYSIADKCPCGRNLPLMDISGGRITDFLVTPEGTIISGASLTIFLIANTPGIGQAQLIQYAPDEIVFRIVKKNNFDNNSIKYIQQEFPKFFGNNMKYHIEFVESIPAEASGKYRFSISHVDLDSFF